MGFQIRKAVITGGSGGVGLALINKLLEEQIEILLLYRKESKRIIRVPRNNLLHLECCALQELGEYMPKEQDYDAFFHLGWANTWKFDRESMELQGANVAYTCAAAELAARCGCQVFVGAGSQAEYGRSDKPLQPDTLCVPENAYGVMKLCANHASRVVCHRLGIRHIWPRILSGYGIYDDMYSVLNSTIIGSLEGKKPEFSKGEQIWDFVHMDDIANALYLIALKGKDGVNYPIGSGDARPLREYLTVLCSKLGNLDEVEFGKRPYDKSQIMHLEADISRLQEDTGWQPEVSFEEGIEGVIKFHRGQV